MITGESRRYAFIEYHRSHEADRAYADGNNSLLDGRHILVDREFGRTVKGWRPRRQGGGLGGRMESGQQRFGCRALPFAGDYQRDRSRKVRSSPSPFRLFKSPPARKLSSSRSRSPERKHSRRSSSTFPLSKDGDHGRFERSTAHEKNGIGKDDHRRRRNHHRDERRDSK